MSLKSKKGFTLIELVVVIAIIAILGSLVLAYLAGALVKARDVRRISDLDNINKALITGNVSTWQGVPMVQADYHWQDFSNDLRSYFPGGLPVDPTNNLFYNYIYCSSPFNRQNFLLAVRMENEPIKPGLNGQVSYPLENCVSSSAVASHLVPICDGAKNYCLGALY